MSHQTKGKKPLVSVIVPTFNRPAMLKDALKSIAAQTYRPIEVIVVNDAGSDVESIVSRSIGRDPVIYLKHASNKGLAAARNTGLRGATGDYITYLDDDDVYYPDHVQTLVSFLSVSELKVAYTDAHQAEELLLNKTTPRFWLRDTPQRALSFLYQSNMSRLLPSSQPYMKLSNTGVDIFFRGGYNYRIVRRTIPFSHEFDREMMLVRNLIPVICIMHHRSCLERTGFFDETLTTHEDWDLWIRMSQEYDFAHIKRITCEYTVRGDGSNMTRAIRADFKRTMEIIYQRYSYLARNPTILEAQKASLQALERELASA